MAYNGALRGFFDEISRQDSTEALIEATIDQIDNAIFRDMYIGIMN